MLVLIPREKALNYLDETKDQKGIKSFFAPYNQNQMQAHSILRFQRKENAQHFNTGKLLDYCEYPELAGTLDLN